MYIYLDFGYIILRVIKISVVGWAVAAAAFYITSKQLNDQDLAFIAGATIMFLAIRDLLLEPK